MRTPESKVITMTDAMVWRQHLADAGQALGITNGCFDLLHRGHVEYLNKAREAVDALLVLVNSDASIRQVKGPSRPVIREDDRVYMLASLEAVDGVVMFDTVNCLSQFEQLRPQVYIKGGDYTEETLVQVEYRLMKSMGTRFVFIPAVEGLSTTELIRRIQRP